MADWRTRNFVPDSDDEDSEETSQHREPQDDSNGNELIPVTGALDENGDNADLETPSSKSPNGKSPQRGIPSVQAQILAGKKILEREVEEQESEDELARPASHSRPKPQISAFLQRLFNPKPSEPDQRVGLDGGTKEKFSREEPEEPPRVVPIVEIFRNRDNHEE